MQKVKIFAGAAAFLLFLNSCSITSDMSGVSSDNDFDSLQASSSSVEPTPAASPTSKPAPTATPAAPHDPELSKKEFEWIGIGASRIDILGMYYEGTTVDYRDLPAPSEFVLEGGGTVSFEYTKGNEDSPGESRVFVTKMTIRDGSGTRTVVADPSVAPVTDFQIQKADFIFSIGPAAEDAVRYAALIDALGDPVEKSGGIYQEEATDTNMRYSRLAYSDIEILLLQRRDTAETDLWHNKRIFVNSDAIAAPGGIRCGMGQAEVLAMLRAGQFHYSTVPDSDNWMLEPFDQGDDGFFVSLVLDWDEYGKLSTFELALYGGDYL